jgi:hypothetical protein
MSTPENQQKLLSYLKKSLGVTPSDDQVKEIIKLCSPQFKEIAKDGLPKVSTEYIVSNEHECVEVAYYDVDKQGKWVFQYVWIQPIF